MHGPAILARRWMQLAVGTDQITAGCRGVFTNLYISHGIYESSLT